MKAPAANERPDAPSVQARGTDGPPGQAASRGSRPRLLRLLFIVFLTLSGAAFAQEDGGGDGVPALRGPDLAEDQAARRRAGIAAEDLPIGTRCTTPGAELDIAGIGRAVYDSIAVDTAAGSARLSGGVCIEVPEVDLVLRAVYFRITGLDGAGLEGEGPRISALEAVLDVGGWRLAVGTLQGPLSDLVLRSIRLTAPGLVGVASSGRIDGSGDPFAASLENVALATSRYRLDAEVARLSGDVLVLEEASGTTCLCRADRFRLLGSAVRANLTTGEGAIEEPILSVLGVRIPLGRDLELGGEGPSLELPFAIAGREDLGTIAIVRGRPEEGVRVEVGAATEPVVSPLALLDVQQGGDHVRFEADGRGLLLQARRRRPLGAGAWVAGFTETVLREEEPRLRNGAEVGWSGEREDVLSEAATLATRLSARVGLDVAVEPRGVIPNRGEPPADRGPAAVRLPFAAELRTGLRLGETMSLDLRARLATVAYLTTPHPGRAAFTLAPTWTVEGSDARLALGATRRWTAGDGPFDFDVPSERFRLVADADVALGPAVAEADVVWRLPPEDAGAEELNFRAFADLPLGGGWNLRPSLRSELAGVAGGPGDEDWVEAELTAWRGEDTRFGLRAREGLAPAEFRDLVLSAQVPVDVGELRLVPYLALDLAPWLRGGGGSLLAGHGLRLYLDDCCGTVILGYRVDEGEWSFEVDFRLPPLDLADPPLEEIALPASMLEALPSEGPSSPPGGPVPLEPDTEPEGAEPDEDGPDGDGPDEDEAGGADSESGASGGAARDVPAPPEVARGEARYGGAS